MDFWRFEDGNGLTFWTAQKCLQKYLPTSKKYGTKENFAKHQSIFLPYAYVTPDGEWHETGRMGWWGMDDATAESREKFRESFEAFLEEAKAQNLLITIVDCHI